MPTNRTPSNTLLNIFFGVVYWSFVSCILILSSAGSACGLTTHIEVAHRALSIANLTSSAFLRRIALTNEEAFHAGAAFPDLFFFPCGGPRDLSEDTHWTPFIKTSVDYILERYGSRIEDWKADAHELVAFIMGVASHQVADVLWHGLGVEQGLIRAMANVNFHAQYEGAHNVADNLDDSLIYFELSMKSRQRLKPWTIPLEDLMEILHRFQPSLNVSSTIVAGCFTVQYSLQVIESMTLDKLFKVNIPGNAFGGARSHFLTSNFYDYHLGGMESMAMATIRSWQNIDTMLLHGTAVCNMDNNPLFVNCAKAVPGKDKAKVRKSQEATLSAGKAAFRFSQRMQSRRFELFRKITGTMDLAKYAKNLIDSNGRLKVSPLQRVPRDTTSFQSKPSIDAGSIIAKGSAEYAYFGQAMVDADLNGDAITDVVIGSPGNNQVTVRLGPVRGLNVATSQQVLVGPRPFERFGATLAVIDFNIDGIPDLAVGAPFSRFKGTVYIYLGTRQGYPPAPDVEIVGHTTESDEWNFEDVAGLGYALDTADMDGDGFKDLVVSSPWSNLPFPQSGSVYLLLAKKRAKFTSPVHISDVAEWMEHGAMPYGWFGKSIRALGAEKLSTRRGLILVSAPYERQCALQGCEFSINDTQAVGKIYAYDITCKGKNTSSVIAALSFTISGTVADEKLETCDLGFPFRAGGAMLAVGADTFTRSPMSIQAGRVTLYDIEEQLLDKGDLRTNSLRPIATFHGEQATERFGTVVRFLDVDDDGEDELVVSSPFHGSGAFDGHQAGQILIYNSEEIARRRRPAYHGSAKVIVEPFSLKGRFGSSVGLFQAPVGSLGGPVSQLLISSPLAMEDEFNQGIVYSYDLTQEDRSTAETAEAQAMIS